MRGGADEFLAASWPGLTRGSVTPSGTATKDRSPDPWQRTPVTQVMTVPFWLPVGQDLLSRDGGMHGALRSPVAGPVRSAPGPCPPGAGRRSTRPLSHGGGAGPAGAPLAHRWHPAPR